MAENTKRIKLQLRFSDLADGNDLDARREQGKRDVGDFVSTLRALGLDVYREDTASGATTTIVVRYPEADDALRATKRGGRRSSLVLPEDSPIRPEMSATSAWIWLNGHTQAEGMAAFGESCSQSTYSRRKKALLMAKKGQTVAEVLRLKL